MKSLQAFVTRRKSTDFHAAGTNPIRRAELENYLFLFKAGIYFLKTTTQVVPSIKLVTYQQSADREDSEYSNMPRASAFFASPIHMKTEPSLFLHGLLLSTSNSFACRHISASCPPATLSSLEHECPPGTPMEQILQASIMRRGAY